MVRNRHRLLGRRARGTLLRVLFVCLLSMVAIVTVRAAQGALSPRIVFSGASAFAQSPADPAQEASLTARVNRDLPMLEDMWGSGGGPVVGVRYLQAPKGIRAGGPLWVSVHGDRPDGHALSGADVEISWDLGGQKFRDVTLTDSGGNVEVSRRLERSCSGKPCVIAVRMYRDDLQSVAYTTFTPR